MSELHEDYSLPPGPSGYPSDQPLPVIDIQPVQGEGYYVRVDGKQWGRFDEYEHAAQSAATIVRNEIERREGVAAPRKGSVHLALSLEEFDLVTNVLHQEHDRLTERTGRTVEPRLSVVAAVLDRFLETDESHAQREEKTSPTDRRVQAFEVRMREGMEKKLAVAVEAYRKTLVEKARKADRQPPSPLPDRAPQRGKGIER